MTDGTLTIASSTDLEFAGVVRAGDELRVQRNQPFVNDEPVAIGRTGGVPTVTNTDAVVFEEAANVDEGGVQIDLGGGPLAPGATPEEDGTSEIEITVNLNSDEGFLDVVGSAEADTFVYASQGVGAGQVNLNSAAEGQPDFDVGFNDVEYPGIFGHDGPDTITSGTGPGADQASFLEIGLVVFGGGGPDVLTGASGSDRLGGDEGDDVIRSGRGTDFVFGGRGRDRMRAGGGFDLSDAKDHDADRVGCGSGRDIAFVDPRDRAHACELKKKGFPVLPGFPEFLFLSAFSVA